MFDIYTDAKREAQELWEMKMRDKARLEEEKAKKGYIDI
jgi:hypothetical protein